MKRRSYIFIAAAESSSHGSDIELEELSWDDAPFAGENVNAVELNEDIIGEHAFIDIDLDDDDDISDDHDNGLA